MNPHPNYLKRKLSMKKSIKLFTIAFAALLLAAPVLAAATADIARMAMMI
jgi:hypothetical protein